MPESAGEIGPFSPRFHKNVGIYLSRSPDLKDKDCLRRFVEILRATKIKCTHKVLFNEIYMIYVCNHIVRIVGGGTLVDDIRPA